MATSGSSDYSRTAQQIINRAFRVIGVLQSGESPSAAELSAALEALEMMVKTWQADGIHLWTYQEATLFPTASTASYSLPGDRCVSTFVETALSAAASSSATSVTVDSISGIADNDVLGIQTSSTAIHWTTVNGTPSGSTINFDDALTADAAEDAVVYAYTPTNLIVRPLRITSVRRELAGKETPTNELSRQDYFDLPNKTSTGTFSQWYYDPGRSTGALYIWPVPNTVNDTIKLTWMRPIEDFDAATNDPDFPQEWLETLAWNLGARLMPEYGISAQSKPEVITFASDLYNKLLGWDQEPASLYFQPEAW